MARSTPSQVQDEFPAEEHPGDLEPSAWNPVFEAQMLTYLRMTKLKLGFVINFGERLVRDGIHRVVNGLTDVPELQHPREQRE